MRIQTVHRDTNPRFYSLLEACESLTGYPLPVNTSFNVRGEPIVCSPEDAYRCFTRSPRRMCYCTILNVLEPRTRYPKRARMLYSAL